jgi:hypothetical protein
MLQIVVGWTRNIFHARFDREPIGNGIGFRNRSPKETENSYYSSDNPINATRGGTGAL